jgi:orotate phosphoribosyltransferase
LGIEENNRMDKTELGRRIFAVSHISGAFLLRSGRRSAEYFDKYLFEGEPMLLQAIAEHMAALVPPDVDVLAGLELGRDSPGNAPVAHHGPPGALCLQAGKAIWHL